MKLVSIFDHKKLRAVQYDDQDCDELTRLIKDWKDVLSLSIFFELNEHDLKSGFYAPIGLEQAVMQTIADAIELQSIITECENDPTLLSRLFKPLNDLEYKPVVLSQQKLKPNPKGWLRLYGIRIDDGIYVITGGAIKLTHHLADREHTQKEVQKLAKVRDWLREQQITDGDGLLDMEI